VHDARDDRALGATNVPLSVPYSEEPYEIYVSAPGRKTQRLEIKATEDLDLPVELPEVKRRSTRSKAPRKTPATHTPATTPPPWCTCGGCEPRLDLPKRTGP